MTFAERVTPSHSCTAVWGLILYSTEDECAYLLYFQVLTYVRNKYV